MARRGADWMLTFDDALRQETEAAAKKHMH